MIVKINGKTSNATISYHFDSFTEKEKKKLLNGETKNYDQAEIKVEIEMETSNGSIIVNE